MSWDQIVEAIRQFWNQPVPIIGFTVGAVVLAVFGIITKTSIGRKQLNRMKTELKETTKHYDDQYLEFERRYNDLKNYYEEKLQLVEQNRLLERQLLIGVCENINNIKIKEMLDEYQSKFEVVNFSEIIEQEKKSAVEEYKAEVESLVNQLKEEIAKLEEMKDVGKEE